MEERRNLTAPVDGVVVSFIEMQICGGFSERRLGFDKQAGDWQNCLTMWDTVEVHLETGWFEAVLDSFGNRRASKDRGEQQDRVIKSNAEGLEAYCLRI